MSMLYYIWVVGIFLGALSNACRISSRTLKGTLILTTTHGYIYIDIDIDIDIDIGACTLEEVHIRGF